MSAEVRIDDDFELAVAEQGAKFGTLYVRVLKAETALAESRPAHEWRDNALRGCLESQVAWGMKLLEGDGVPRDHEAAARWFNMAPCADTPTRSTCWAAAMSSAGALRRMAAKPCDATAAPPTRARLGRV